MLCSVILLTNNTFGHVLCCRRRSHLNEVKNRSRSKSESRSRSRSRSKSKERSNKERYGGEYHTKKYNEPVTC